MDYGGAKIMIFMDLSVLGHLLFANSVKTY